MANETKTEDLTKIHFDKFLDILVIERHQSDNNIIDKLLKLASKKGNGKSRPDFIISYKHNLDLLIVIECKADITKHESENRDKYTDYAVDGALLYASYLSKSFDVLAIAISGGNEQSLEVSHFLHLKDEKKAINVFDKKLLGADDYLNGYLKHPVKFKQDYNTLLIFTKDLNEKLHSHKILESQRILLISAILIALENDAFKRSYASQKNPEFLANFLTDTVLNELKSAEIKGKKLKNLKVQFSFINTDTSLSNNPKILKEIIDEIDANVNTFLKTHKYFDVLGQLYIQFLSYANSDKGLGIVLTPPHITEFFSDLAQVNKNSIIYDNCTGTGGFLISAMKKMIEDAKGDESKIKEIKASQLIGTEYQAHIFALAVSNMYIHQAGKTSIKNGSCFDNGTIENVKSNKPTVGFLNPPYKANKKKDIDELEFVLNNLECLVDGGTCVAIVPMQSALAQKGNVYKLKKKLLEKHTLEAVLSMPNELFFNSDVDVVSCIMIFTAHKPHLKTKETYFGYYKDDGFVKRKTQGRIDFFNKWDITKEKWLSNFINKKNEAGISINKQVSSDMEWVSEAYMDTNYKALLVNDFINTLLSYATFLFGNRLSNQVSSSSFIKKELPLNTDDWEFFNLTDIFKISGSKTTSILELEEYGVGIKPYVTTQATNNGIDGFYNYSTEKGNVLTVDSAVIGYCAYQKFDFSASDHVEVLTPKFEMNDFTAMFFVTILNKEQYRYNYGRKASQNRMKNRSVKLPSINNSIDLSFMENFIKSLPYSYSINLDGTK